MLRETELRFLWYVPDLLISQYPRVWRGATFTVRARDNACIPSCVLFLVSVFSFVFWRAGLNYRVGVMA